MKSFTKNNLFVIALLMLVNIKVFSAAPIFFYSTENFPTVNVKFMLVDNSNRVVTNLSQSTAGINFLDNNVSMNITSFNTSAPPVDKASTVIAFDLSISGRTDNPDEFGYAKDIINNVISYLDPAQCKVALISVSSIPSIEADFTASMTDISGLVGGFSVRSFGNLYRGITLANTGALAVLENETNTNKSILLVTQGIISADERDLIIAKAKENNAKINILYISKTIPSNIRKIAEETGGYCINKEMMDKIGLHIFSSIAKLSEGYTPYSLTANGIVNCDGKHNFRLNTNNYGSNDFSVEIDNILLTKIETNPQTLEFPFVKPTTNKTDSVTIYSRNTDLTINAIYTDNSSFTISGLPSFPYNLKKDDSLKLKISFSPVDSCISFSRLLIVSNACNYDTLFMTGGYPNVAPRTPTIKIINPKCNDVLIIGDTIEIEWNGVLPTDVVSLFSGKLTPTDTTADTIARNVVGLKHKYAIEDNGKEDSIKFFIKQNWPNNIGKTLDFKHDAPVLSAYWNNYQDRIVTTDNDNFLTIWNANTGAKIHTFPKFSKTLRHAKYAPNNSINDTYIGVPCYDSCVYFFDANDFSTYWRYKTSVERVHSIEFSPDGKYAVIGLENGMFELLDIEKRTSILRKYSNDETCLFSVFHPTKQEIMTISNYAGVIRFFNFDGEPLDTIDVKQGYKSVSAEHVCYNPYGNLVLFTNMSASTADLIDRATGEILYSIVHPKEDTNSGTIYYSALFYSDPNSFGGLSDCILTSCEDATIRRWNISDGSPTDVDHIFAEHKGPVNTAMLSKDGWRLLSSSADSTAKIWNLNQKTLQSDTTCMFRIAYARGNVVDTLDLGNAFQSEIIIKTFESAYANICDFNYNIKAIRIVGDNPADFLLVDEFDFPMNINEAGKIDFNIAFRPTEQGTRNAKIQIIIPNDTLYIHLVGVGLNIGLRPLCELIDFRDVFIDDYKDTLLPIAVNISDNIITITNIYLTGPQKANFKFITDNTGVSLYPNDTLFSEIRFFPLTTGRKNAVMNIQHTYHLHPLSFNVMGKGMPIVNDTIQITINNFTGEQGQIINCPIAMNTLTHNNNIADLNEIIFSIVYNSTLIYPMTYSNEVRISNTNLLNNGYSITDITIPYKPGQQRIDGLQFVGLLGNDTTTNIQIVNTKTISYLRYYVAGNTSIFNLINNCNAGGTRLFDENGKLALNQNVPNPSVNETKIDFELLENGYASLDIYDIAGKHIINVFAEHKQKGSYSITLDTKALLPGIYYYILYNARQQKIQSMLVE